MDGTTEGSIPSSYQASFPVAYFNDAPRFGHTDDLAGVINGSERYNDYAQGTAFTAGFILFLFVIWVAFLVLFACCGRTVGILSGRRILDSESSRKHVAYRMAILVLCLGTVVSGIIFLVVAGNRTDKTFDSVRSGVASVSAKGDEVTDIADRVIKAGNEIIPVRDLVVKLVDRGICNSFDGGNGARVSVDPIAEEAALALTQLSDFTMGEFTDIRNNFNSEFTKYEGEVLKVVDDAESYINISLYAIVVIIFAFFLAAETYMSWFGPRFRYFFLAQTWFVVPCFFIFLIMSAIAASAIGSGLVVNSDACIGGDDGTPEGFIKAILDFQNENIDPYARKVVDHYILNGCQDDFDGYTTVENLANEMRDALEAVSDLKTMLDGGINTFEVACDGEPGSLVPVSDALATIQYTIVSFISITEQALNLVECKPINDIYTTFFHNGVCKNLPSALYSMFVSIVLVLAFGMVIFTLRGALLPNIMDDEPDDYYYTSSRRWGGRNRARNGPEDDDDEFDYDDPPQKLSRSNDYNDVTAKEDVFFDDDAPEDALTDGNKKKDTFIDNDIEITETADVEECGLNSVACGDAGEAATIIQKSWRNLMAGRTGKEIQDADGANEDASTMQKSSRSLLAGSTKGENQDEIEDNIMVENIEEEGKEDEHEKREDETVDDTIAESRGEDEKEDGTGDDNNAEDKDETESKGDDRKSEEGDDHRVLL